ncbi:hypothetical protein M405DRAFT_869795 [Rhizopogon salebrosus TDB-379]|nr:hypothetical protein M405DRAFT_869795 [Rhizopogon salebrosus TDB-379]
MSRLAQSSNVITAEIANQELVKALQQLEVTVGHGLRLQQTPNDAFALETRRQLGRDIGYALNDLFDKYGDAATMVPPRLLSMALEVYLCQAGTLNLVHAPDWTKNLVDHQLYKTHRLYSKTLTYNALHMQAGPASAPQSQAAPTTAPAPAPAPVNVPAPAPEPAPAPVNVPAPAPEPAPAPVNVPAPAPELAPVNVPAAAPVPAPAPVPVNVPAPAPVTAPAPVFPGYAERPTSIHTPPRPGPSRKRALSGSSSTKDAGRTSPKKRKFKTSSKAKVSTFISKQPAQPAQSKPKGKSKQAAKSKAILTDTDDEEEKKAPKYVELSEDDTDADADGDGDAPMVPAATLPGIIVQKKKASDICLLRKVTKSKAIHGDDDEDEEWKDDAGMDENAGGNAGHRGRAVVKGKGSNVTKFPQRRSVHGFRHVHIA